MRVCVYNESDDILQAERVPPRLVMCCETVSSCLAWSTCALHCSGFIYSSRSRFMSFTSEGNMVELSLTAGQQGIKNNPT